MSESRGWIEWGVLGLASSEFTINTPSLTLPGVSVQSALVFLYRALFKEALVFLYRALSKEALVFLYRAL